MIGSDGKAHSIRIKSFLFIDRIDAKESPLAPASPDAPTELLPADIDEELVGEVPPVALASLSTTFCIVTPVELTKKMQELLFLLMVRFATVLPSIVNGTLIAGKSPLVNVDCRACRKRRVDRISADCRCHRCTEASYSTVCC